MLARQGFERKNPTISLAEGLLVYLREEHVRSLFQRIDDLSAPGSVVLTDIVGRSFLESPPAKELNDLARQQQPPRRLD
jgi:O-methyltransferase involved in polyketide biosynthesis